MLIKLLPILCLPIASAMDLKMDETICSCPGTEHTSLVFHSWGELPWELKKSTSSKMSTSTLLNFRSVSKESFGLALKELENRWTHPIRISFFDGCKYPVSGLSTVYVTLKNSKQSFTRIYTFPYAQGKRIVPNGYSANFTDIFPLNTFPLKAEAELISGYVDNYPDKNAPWQDGKIDLGVIPLTKIMKYEGTDLLPVQGIRFSRENTTFSYNK